MGIEVTYATSKYESLGTGMFDKKLRDFPLVNSTHLFLNPNVPIDSAKHWYSVA